MKLLWKWNDAENCYAQWCSYTFRFSSLCWFHVHMILFVFLPSMLVITWTAFCRICFAVSSTLSGMFLFLRLFLSVIWLNYFQFETLWLILNWFMLGLCFVCGLWMCLDVLHFTNGMVVLMEKKKTTVALVVKYQFGREGVQSSNFTCFDVLNVLSHHVWIFIRSRW